MKKSLVALATLSVVGTAFADVDVSGGIKLYGVLDQAVTNQTLTDPSVASRSSTYTSLFASSATSRFGVKGNRDLGDGFKGRIQVEIQVEPDNATQLPSKNRGAFVGLAKEGAGEILLGTQETTAYEIFGMDVNGRVEYKPQVWRTTKSADMQDRSNNAIKYISPDFGGLTVHFMRGYTDKASTTYSNSFVSYGVKYSQDKLKAAYVHDKLTNAAAQYKFAGLVDAGPSNEGATYSSSALVYGGSATSTSSNVQRDIGAVTYDFGMLSVNYIYAKSYVKDTNAGSNTTNTVGVKVPYEKFTFAMSYGGGTIDSYNSSATTAISKDTTFDDTTLGVYYNIDKATSVYFLNSNSNYLGGVVQDGRNTTYAIGARYNF